MMSSRCVSRESEGLWDLLLIAAATGQPLRLGVSKESTAHCLLEIILKPQATSQIMRGLASLACAGIL